MCGRFTRNYTWAQIHAMYSLTSPASNLQPRFNICPTDTVDTVINHELVPMRWGLVPNWWGKPIKELKAATFNARAETVAEKPMFRSAVRTSRCLIPASDLSTKAASVARRIFDPQCNATFATQSAISRRN